MLSFPGLAHRMEKVGRLGSVLFVNDCKATNADAAARRCRPSTNSTGSPAASRRPAASHPLADFFPRSRKAYLIGEATEDFAATLEGQVPFVRAETIDKAVLLAAADALRSRDRPSRWCCSLRPAPPSTSSAISRNAARPSRRPCCASTGSRPLPGNKTASMHPPRKMHSPSRSPGAPCNLAEAARIAKPRLAKELKRCSVHA